jgi:hypothetical protein
MNFFLRSSLAVGVIVAACACRSGPANTHALKAPAEARIDERVTVTATGSFTADDRLLWTATGGRFEGPVSGPSVLFVPTTSGAVTVLLTVQSPQGGTTVSDVTINVGGAAAQAGSTVGEQLQATAATPLNIVNVGYIPSGFMGDGEMPGLVKFDAANRERPHSPPTAFRIQYTPGAVQWAAIAWQFPPNNWGDQRGRDLRSGNYRQVSIWARGIKSRDNVMPTVQFKAGGTTDPARPFAASFEVAGDFVTLTEDWRQYTLDVSGRDLSNVAAAVVVVIRAQDVGAYGATFDLDDLEYR